MKKLFVSLILLMTLSINANAYMDRTTHPHMTEKSVEKSLIANTDYLKIYLGLPPSNNDTPHTTTKLSDNNKTETIQDWIKFGSEQEDFPMCRASNHFHDPLQTWIESGVDDIPWYINLYCTVGDDGIYGPGNIVSNIIWSTGYKLRPISDEQEYQDEIAMTANQWDWESARRYFYFYLCGHSYYSLNNAVQLDKAQREAYLAKSFRAIGQILHLLQDMAVPAHVRNDFFIGHQETIYQFLEKEYGIIPVGWQIPIGNIYEGFVSYHNNADWFERDDIDSFFLEPNMFITDFWDLDKYSGVVTYDSSERLGLAEFTNMNFVSSGSSFTSNNTTDEYPFPNEESTNYMEYLNKTLIPETIVDNFGIERKIYYLSKIKDGMPINRFMIPSYLSAAVHDTKGNLKCNFKRRYHMDENCYADQASILIPRAIGYSASLIDYFFRGKIDLIPDTDTGYGYVIENNSDEVMVGFFELYYDRVIGQDEDNQDIIRRAPVMTILGTPFVHWQTIQPHNRSENVLSFNIPEDAANPGEYILVFNGRLGKENNAVAGKVLTLEDMNRYLDLSLPADGYYARTDRHPYYQNILDPRYVDDPETTGFDKIIVNVKNIGPEHVEITGGIVKLAVIYRMGSGDQFSSPPAATSFGFYILNKEIAVEEGIPRDNPIRLEFDLADTEIPLWATDIYLNLAYEGDLFLEPGYSGNLGTAGQTITADCSGFRDISEPTPIDVFNLMDVICLDDGSGPLLYQTGSDAALNIVDTNVDGTADEWDIYTHDIEDMVIKFSRDCNEPACKYSIPYLEAGEYKRLFVLSDYQGERNIFGGSYKTLAVDPFDTRYHSQYYFVFEMPYKGMINQSIFGNFPECSGEGYCWRRNLTTIEHSYRGLDVFNRFVRVNDGYPGGADPLIETLCSYEDE